MYIPRRDRREWLAQRLESTPPAVDQNHILNLLARADIFEQVIQSRYLGTKRFSLEGVTALIPFLDELLNRSAELGAQRSIMGMSHRGRLSVMVNTFGKSPIDIFAKFEDVDPRSILGGGDVKYHVGATGSVGDVFVVEVELGDGQRREVLREGIELGLEVSPAAECVVGLFALVRRSGGRCEGGGGHGAVSPILRGLTGER
jgi:hypothetical protein